MSKPTLISTVYNESETIRELLESIVDQSETPDEVVIVDGG
ncbi:MAG: glycosyltransferase, partial [Halobacteriaceae archaeon]